ncbi:MAG TPA: S8 family serine peptidase [Gaiellaceae bacterium]|nr:S8 family serine peptidase [Gaiellaceae bacterium]
MTRALAAVAGVALLLAAAASAADAFTNTEPFAAEQWYLPLDRAWDFWPSQPQLAPIRVAVVDSGVDGKQPDLEGRILLAKSFVGGSALTDTDGHGTFVAGEIAANPSNGIGIAGLAFNARLLIAKVVTPDGSVPLAAEVAAIHWAVDHGARVVNLSLGGVRDPLDPSLDTYSPQEEQAVEYAYAKGAVVVAAVGNGPQSPHTPWPFAHYPAALPHVIGVSAVRRDGSVPAYSNRDSVYNDLAAPGDAIFSTIPYGLVTDPACPEGPYSVCGPLEFRDAIGTSFAAPQVAAAAALLLGEVPSLTPDQVAWALERGAVDEDAATGCPECSAGRDAFTGWGRLDVARSLALATDGARLPPLDAYEPNDDAGAFSHALPPLPRSFVATLDDWDDDRDVYRVVLKAGQRLYARLTAENAGRVTLELWSPRTRRIEGADAALRLTVARAVGKQRRLAYTARKSGTYYLAATLENGLRDRTRYRLAVARA